MILPKNQKMLPTRLLSVLFVLLVGITASTATTFITKPTNITLNDHTLTWDTTHNRTHYNTILSKRNCTWHKANQTWTPCYKQQRQKDTQYNITHKKTWQEIQFDTKSINITKQWNVWCWQNTTHIVCKDMYDGSGKIHKQHIGAGESFVVIERKGTKVYIGTGHNKDLIEKKVADTKEALSAK